jgi:hypothetical protein
MFWCLRYQGLGRWELVAIVGDSTMAFDWLNSPFSQERRRVVRV